MALIYNKYIEVRAWKNFWIEKINLKVSDSNPYESGPSHTWSFILKVFSYIDPTLISIFEYKLNTHIKPKENEFKKQSPREGDSEKRIIVSYNLSQTISSYIFNHCFQNQPGPADWTGNRSRYRYGIKGWTGWSQTSTQTSWTSFLFSLNFMFFLLIYSIKPDKPVGPEPVILPVWPPVQF